MSADPLRLFEDFGMPERVRADLSQARDTDAGYDTEGGLARFAAVVALAPASGVVLHAAEAAAPHVASGATAGAGGATGVAGASGAATAGSAATSGAASVAGGATAGSASISGVATAGAGSVAGGSATGLLGALGAKLAVGVVAGGIAVGAMAFGVSGDAQPVPVVARVAAPAEAAVAASRAHMDRALAADQAGEVALPHGDTGEPEPAAAPRRASAAMPSSSATRALEEETEHLAALREAAASEPARAARMAEEGARRFPRGVFAQEREVIAIRALAASGRGAEARVRAAAFRARHPESPAAEGLRRIAGDEAGP